MIDIREHGISAGKKLVGNAQPGDVLSGKTFSNADGNDKVGTMPNRGAVTITPGTSDQTITAGYHNGAGKVLGDPDLVTGNIKAGVNIFGVAGKTSVVDTADANAVAGHILTGKSGYVNGSKVTGTMADNGSKTVTPTTTDQQLAAGYYSSLIVKAGVAKGQTATFQDLGFAIPPCVFSIDWTLNSGTVRCVAQDASGNFWYFLQTNSGNLFKCDKDGKVLVALSTPNVIIYDMVVFGGYLFTITLSNGSTYYLERRSLTDGTVVSFASLSSPSRRMFVDGSYLYILDSSTLTRFNSILAKTTMTILAYMTTDNNFVVKNGYAYVTNTSGTNRVQKFNASTEALVWEYNIASTGGLTVDAFGNVYVHDPANGNITKINSNGAFVWTHTNPTGYSTAIEDMDVNPSDVNDIVVGTQRRGLYGVNGATGETTWQEGFYNNNSNNPSQVDQVKSLSNNEWAVCCGSFRKMRSKITLPA